VIVAWRSAAVPRDILYISGVPAGALAVTAAAFNFVTVT
jgi:hypothetical protein